MKADDLREDIVIGAGPNGLAAAITLAQAGCSVLLIEGSDVIGGGARTAELTLPGFRHDICSAVHPMAVISPVFQNLPLERHGLKWITPPVALAHPFDDNSAACLFQSIDETAETLGVDASAYRKLISPFAKHSQNLFDDLLRPLRIPHHPLPAARFGFWALQSAAGLARRLFRGKEAQGLFGGLAAHSFLPLSKPPSAAIGLMLAVAGHAVGWPIPEGGSQKITGALASYFQEKGGKIATGRRIRTLGDIPQARSVLFDLNPEQLLKMTGGQFSQHYRRRLSRFRPGPGVFKMDFALSGPIPWAAAPCRRAGTVHLGGTLEEMMISERAPWLGQTAERPFTLLSQPSLFDATRAPEGKHTAWAYCHVPRGSTEDLTGRIENQIERFAPGFRKLILARHVMFPSDLERHNPNFIGGDISGGIADLWQILFRPVVSFFPYRTSVKNWYLCSASTPPGAGVHGLCGYFAARDALKRF